MRKHLLRFFTLIAVGLCMSGLIACSKRAPQPDKLDSVEKIEIVEDEEQFTASWTAAEERENYLVNVCGTEIVTLDEEIDLRGNDKITLPANGEITISVVVRAIGRGNSDPVTVNYTTRGVQLTSPEIEKLENDVLTWKERSNASAYKVLVDGKNVSDGSTDGQYHASSLDLKPYSGERTIEIMALGNAPYFSDSGSTKVKINANHSRLAYCPVTVISVKDNILSWGGVGGAKSYRIVSLDGSSKKIDETSIDLLQTDVVRGIYPISDIDFIDSADYMQENPATLKYLEGEGTEASPFLIKTPSNMRAIEYYESVYEFNKSATKKPYVYRIENDLDYNNVDVGEDESNYIYSAQPLFGTLDGNGKKLSNIRAKFDDGYWAMFDRITPTGVVKDLTIESAEIEVNGIYMDSGNSHPLNGDVAAIAYVNEGTIQNVTVSNAHFKTIHGGVGGIASINRGKVKDCTVTNSKLENIWTKTNSELGGIVVNNLKGAEIDGCKVDKLTINGNIKASGGIAGINRGTVKNCNAGDVEFTLAKTPAGEEFGGIVGYTTSDPSNCTVTSFKIDGKEITNATGAAGNKYRGKNVGKKGTV